MEKCPNCDELQAEKAKVIITKPNGDIVIASEGFWCESCGAFTPEVL